MTQFLTYPSSNNTNSNFLQTVVNNKLILPECETINLFSAPKKELRDITNTSVTNVKNKALQTPCKKAPQRRFPIEESNRLEKQQKVEAPSPFLEICKKAEEKEIIINNKNVSLESFATGSYLEAYEVTTHDNYLIDNVPNTQLLLKIFLKKHAYNTTKCQTYIKTAIGNYTRALNLGLPCAKIYTSETDMFYLVEKIPNKIVLTKKEQLNQIRKFFEVSHKNGYLCDLSYDNLRVREDGTVVLIDFVEKNFDYNDQSKFRIFAIQFLKSWAKQVQDNGKDRHTATYLLLDLTAGLGIEEAWINAALNEYWVELNHNVK